MTENLNASRPSTRTWLLRAATRRNSGITFVRIIYETVKRILVFRHYKSPLLKSFIRGKIPLYATHYIHRNGGGEISRNLLHATGRKTALLGDYVLNGHEKDDKGGLCVNKCGQR